MCFRCAVYGRLPEQIEFRGHIDNDREAENTCPMMKRKLVFVLLFFLALGAEAQTGLEDYFNLCLEFGAPLEVVQLFQPFRTYKGENNGTISYVVKEDNSLLKDKPYSEYQIWYTIDKELGLYQSTLILRGDKPVLQSILTGYLKKFSALHGEPVYTNLENGSLLVFWYNETTFTVKARLILDIVNPYKFVSITYCSPQMKHTNLLKTLYYGTPEDQNEAGEQPVSSPSDAQPAEGGEEQKTDGQETAETSEEEKTGEAGEEQKTDNQEAAGISEKEKTDGQEAEESGDDQGTDDTDMTGDSAPVEE